MDALYCTPGKRCRAGQIIIGGVSLGEHCSPEVLPQGSPNRCRPLATEVLDEAERPRHKREGAYESRPIAFA
ncbi:unnamed protein product [Chrysoparadoxa australica]